MTATYPVLTLKKGKERSLLLRHPWVFSGAVDKEPKNLTEGDTVLVNSSEGKYLGTGHFHRGTILVRCISFEEKPIDQDFWTEKIRKAVSYREKTGIISKDTANAFRLIHGEGDDCPGLVVDIYGNTAILQTYTIGMHRSKALLSAAITEVLGQRITAIYDKSADTMDKQSSMVTENGYLWKAAAHQPEDHILENGLKFHIDYVEGQKTGFFIDQRENRSLLRTYSKDRSVLNTFCYTGGFSVNAIASGASLVHSVDSSAKAMEATAKNVAINFPESNHEGFTSDVMSFFKKTEQQYDVIILDPPAYAKHLSQVKNAMVGYRNLNTEGLRRIKPGGILFTFSCSQAVDALLFRKIIFQAAIQARRNVRIMHQLSQPADHPVSIYHPEAEYLKGFVLFVE
jgi:23S rRNA (cytosine1962-C5)-methyltransferase